LLPVRGAGLRSRTEGLFAGVDSSLTLRMTSNPSPTLPLSRKGDFTYSPLIKGDVRRTGGFVSRNKFLIFAQNYRSKPEKPLPNPLLLGEGT